ncbi:MAG: Ig-like domain-containing protein, partial [Vicinamibacterales bacterium]
QCWSSGANVDLQVDLGSARSVGAFRAHLFGYQFWDALKGQVQDRVEILTSTDGVTFASQGFLPTSLWRKDIPINHMLQDDETATGWNFEQTLASAVQARYVRYHITPKRNLCVSELQVFDRIDYQPFDLRIALPGSVAPPENVPPSVTVTSPADQAQYQQPSPITVTADAQDTDGTVTRVDVFAGSTLIGSASSSPFTIVWANAPAGQYVITAAAIDDSGATTTSAGVSVTVDPPPPVNQPPQVALTSPAASAAFTAPATVAVAADASDPDNAIARVEFFAGATSIGVADAPPYRATWSNLPAGLYALTAVATDVSGAATTSAPVNLTVGEGTPDNLPPLVNVTNPAPSATFTSPASVSIMADATDPDNAVAQVEFRANGSSIGIATAEPYQITWSNVVAGQYSLTATATDASGASTTSATVNILVTNVTPPPNQPPQATLTSPTASMPFTAPASVPLAANATDPDNAVARVEFFAGATSLGALTAPPYQMTWSDAPAGQYALTAVATDASGASTVSSPVTITIAPAPQIDCAIDEIV